MTHRNFASDIAYPIESTVGFDPAPVVAETGAVQGGEIGSGETA